MRCRGPELWEGHLSKKKLVPPDRLPHPDALKKRIFRPLTVTVCSTQEGEPPHYSGHLCYSIQRRLPPQNASIGKHQESSVGSHATVRSTGRIVGHLVRRQTGK